MSRTLFAANRVLQVHHFRYGTILGGVDRVVTELFDGLGGRNAVLFEVGQWDDKALTKRVEGDLTIYRRRLRLPGQPLSLLRRGLEVFEIFLTLLQLVRLIKREKIDLVHLHTLQDYHWYFMLLARLGLCSYIVTLHRGETVEYPNRPESQRSRWNSILRYTRRVTAVSAELARLATVNLPILSSPDVVYNGIDDPASTTKDDNNPLYMISKPYAMCVGTLKHYKGHDIVIKAWSELLKKGISLDLYIAGDGEDRKKLEALSQDLGCTEYVHFLGAVPHGQALCLVRHADYYIMPSRNEGLGIALLEAAAFERPIVASNIPVFCEIVEDGISAELFPLENYHALAEKIVLLKNDLSRRTTLGLAARQQFLNKFTKEKMILNYRKVYQDVCGG